MAGNEISLVDKVGRFDRSFSESQMRNGYAARLLGIVSKICLSVKIRMVSDDLDRILVGAYRTVGSQSPEFAGGRAAGAESSLSSASRERFVTSSLIPIVNLGL